MEATLTPDKAAEQAAALDAARERVRDEEQLFEAPSQLSFDIGAPRRSSPDFATLKIGGTLGVTRDLLYQEHVTVTVTDAHGEVIATQPATIGWPAFKDKTTGELTFTERAHTATVD